MDNISNIRLGPLPSDSPYMKPFRSVSIFIDLMKI